MAPELLAGTGGDARIRRVPTTEEVRAIEKDYPGTHILPQVRPGMWLSDLPEQDSYSFALAYIYMGARNQSTLLKNYDRVLKKLDFRFEQVDDALPRVSEESEPPS